MAASKYKGAKLHYLTAFFIAAMLSLMLTPLALYISIKGKVFDRPGLRKIHQKATPCLGGTAIATAQIITFWVVRELWPGIFSGMSGKFLSITFGGLIILGVGLYDDLKNASVALRLVFQFISAGILIAGGFCITMLPNPLGGAFPLGVFSIPFSALWIVFIINAINFIDGLDGLAAGIAVIVATAIFVSAEASGEALIGLLSIVTVGTLIGFLPFNFHPARIFLGDSGATFIGFILAAMTTLGTMKSIATVALLIPIAALGVPIVDTFSAVLRRTWRGQMFYQADKEHVHHTLLTIGFSHQGAVMFLYGITVFLAILAMLLSLADRRLISILIGLFIILVWIFIKKWQKGRD
jgi:UDP-GlcNAc:undecaprenyl-phosphate GlcNAc-1-phosphate transferase